MNGEPESLYTIRVAGVSGFFQPPPSRRTKEATGGEPPPWFGRPQGAPPGKVVSGVALARSEIAEVHIAYVDAFPEGFEFVVEAITVPGAEGKLLREGEDRFPDIFGRHWPMAGERSDAIPAQLLRVGVQFADGRTATNITGHDRPQGGPILWPLTGGSSGGRFDQGFWVTPLPPPGPVAFVCEWPAAEIPLRRHEVDAQSIFDAADRAQAVFPHGDRVLKEGREWRLGSDADVAWINDGTSPGTAITAAIPPTFASYCTLERPESRKSDLPHQQAVIQLLTEHTDDQPWWLGYRGREASEVVFPYAPRTTVYAGHEYVLVQAGPRQAAGWRESRFDGFLPDLMFPADHSWLLSTMWSDDWTSIGGSEHLVSSFLRHTELGPRARRVSSDQAATPPDHGSD